MHIITIIFAVLWWLWLFKGSHYSSFGFFLLCLLFSPLLKKIKSSLYPFHWEKSIKIATFFSLALCFTGYVELRNNIEKEEYVDFLKNKDSILKELEYNKQNNLFNKVLSSNEKYEKYEDKEIAVYTNWARDAKKANSDRERVIKIKSELKLLPASKAEENLALYKELIQYENTLENAKKIEKYQKIVNRPKLSPLDKCIKKGIAYFKEIGSYPNLSDGRFAETVAEIRCENTLEAFN